MKNNSTGYIPQAFTGLKLMQAFKGYNPSVTDCMEITSAERIMIIDEGFTHITDDPMDAGRCCFAINPSLHELVVLPLDKRLVKQRDGGMADGAVFDASKFAFLEFKDQAEGNSESLIQYTYDKATSQLEAALQLFRQQIASCGINLDDQREVECHVIVSESFPRSKAREQAMMTAFALDTDGVTLSFEREVLFG